MTADVALALLQGGDPIGALALLDDATAADETGADHLVARGMVLLANHHSAEALTALRMAVALGDTMPATLLNLALAEDQAGDPARALHLMQALENHLPAWDEPPLRLAETLRTAVAAPLSWSIPRKMRKSASRPRPKASCPFIFTAGRSISTRS